jgi:hypothetical protein
MCTVGAGDFGCDEGDPNFGNLNVEAMTHIGWVQPVLKSLPNDGFRATQPFPPAAPMGKS